MVKQALESSFNKYLTSALFNIIANEGGYKEGARKRSMELFYADSSVELTEE